MVREHHNESTRSIHFTNKRLQKKFVPRKEYHDNNDYKRSSDKVAVVNAGQFGDGALSELQVEIEALKSANADCEVTINDLLPRDAIIDSKSTFYSSRDSLAQIFGQAMSLYESSQGRVDARKFPQRAQEVLDNYDEIKTEDFSRILRATDSICRQTNLTIFVESIVDLAREGELTDLQKAQVLSVMTNSLLDSLEVDSLQDNTLMALSLMKGMGNLSGRSSEYRATLEEVYDAMTAEYEKYSSKSSDTDKLVRPGDVYRDYRTRQRALAAELMDVIYANFDEFIEE